MPEILALVKLRQEDYKFEASPGYTERLCLKKAKPKTTKKNYLSRYCQSFKSEPL
jgi:hypothetical protein